MKQDLTLVSLVSATAVREMLTAREAISYVGRGNFLPGGGRAFYGHSGRFAYRIEVGAVWLHRHGPGAAADPAKGRENRGAIRRKCSSSLATVPVAPFWYQGLRSGGS